MPRNKYKSDDNDETDRQIFGDEIDDSVTNENVSDEVPVNSLNKDNDFSGEAISAAINTKNKSDQQNNSSPSLSSGDIDADWNNSTGEENSLGSVETPDQDQVDSISEPWGTNYPTDEELGVNEHERRLERKKQKDEIDNLEEK